MTTQTLPKANDLHAAYQRLTGADVMLTLQRIYAWEVWSLRGWTEADLALVINRVKKLIAENRKWPSALHFRRLIEDLDHFEELLSEARALARVPRRDTARDQALASAGRRKQDRDTARPVRDILAEERAFERFRAMKDSL